MTLFAGVLALATVGCWPHGANDARASETASPQIKRLTEVDIARIKTVLRLTAAQQRYWAPVEAALIGIARQQAQAEPDGFIPRISRRVVTIGLKSAAVVRLAAAARPLINTLDDEQKLVARMLAQGMGLGPMIAQLN
jgi:hypothetical protein